MKITINGVTIEKGTMVRFIDDRNFTGLHTILDLPIFGGFYIVRGFTPGVKGTNILLEGVINPKFDLGYEVNGTKIDLGYGEPGFRPERFEAFAKPAMSNKDAKKESKSTGIKIKIKKEVIESLELEKVSAN